MCLIYYRDAAKHTATIDYATLGRAYVGNPDGTGIAWFNTKDNAWHVWRSIKASWKQVKKRLAAIDAMDSVSRIVVHFRFATHGGANLDNCHPFPIADNALLFHNGCFSGIDTDERDRSDTRQVADSMSRIVANGGKLRDAWRPIKLLASSNRLLLTLPNGKVAYAGSWSSRSDGCYSNPNCFPIPKTQYHWAKYDNGKQKLLPLAQRYGLTTYRDTDSDYRSSDYPYRRSDDIATSGTADNGKLRDIYSDYDDYNEYASEHYTQGDREFLRELADRIDLDEACDGRQCDIDTQLDSID